MARLTPVRRRARGIVLGVVALALFVVGAVLIGGGTARHPTRGGAATRAAGEHYGEREGEESEEGRAGETYEETLARDAWFFGPRMFPGTSIPAGARTAAAGQARELAAGPHAAPSAAWTNIGPRPVDTENPLYDDPSNGSVYPNGFHDVAGRVSAIAVSRQDSNLVYAGGADGGVWKSTNGGSSWTAVGDKLATLAIGAIALDPRRAATVYVGTGEANTNADSYFGAGIYRSRDGGATFSKLGGTLFDTSTVFRIIVAPRNKVIYAATNQGLYRSADKGATWTRVLAPGGTTDLYGNFVTDVVFMPKTGRTQILAAIGWRGNPGGGADANNGLWLSTDSGLTFSKLSPTGFPAQQNLGRISLAVQNATPNLIYAVIQDAVLMNTPGANTVLNGVYKTTAGPNGPWQLVATSQVFAADPNSALSPDKIGPTYQPGIQAWYNQYVVIDPTDPNDVVVGLEEIYNSTDGGGTWHTIGRYWNICLTPVPPNCDLDPIQHPTTHPDQHAAAFGISNGKPKLYAGNDGGVWSQTGPSWSNDGWSDLNARLSITQPYYAEASAGPNPTIYAGTQDNGNLKYTGSQTWPEIFGGDGGDVGVEPNNPNHTYEEYVYLQMSSSKDGGLTWTNDIGPADAGSSSTARFIAPFDLDPLDPTHHLVALGQHVWESHDGINTGSGSWTSSYDFGSTHVGTALAVRGSTIYGGWCGPCNPDTIDNDNPFARGLASNVGGTWHTLAATGLPNRYVSSITIDPGNSSHLFVTLSAFSRHWIPRAGEGHVFESTNSGATFTDISANLPDAPANDSVLVNGSLIVGTDVGVFQRVGASWQTLGTGLPNASVLDLSVIPGTSTVVAASHGRGIWTVALP
jgi:hypothetical protein